MIVERVIGRAEDHALVDWLEIDWRQTLRRALRLTSGAGRRVNVLLPRQHPTLRDGDVLALTGDCAVAIRVRPQRLIRLRPTSLPQMGRLCAELGNQHAPLELCDAEVIVLDDGPMRETADRLGIVADAFVGAFHPLYAADRD